MAILGAHMSIAGGYFRAVERAAEASCECVQIFSKNNNQWRAKPITDEDVALFGTSLSQHGIGHTLVHSSYLINLASPDRALWKKSVDAFVVELQRAATLSIPYVVLHPGSHTTASEAAGIRNVIRALNEVHRQTRHVGSRCLLENTAGQGSNLGWRFEQLASILDGVRDPDRLGVCLDTCHLFAAGYPLEQPGDFRNTFREFNAIVGIKRVKAFHLNDSKRELGSRVDRHEHIGKGHLGLAPFRHLLNDRRFRRVPMYLETAKGKNGRGTDWDVANLRTLRKLINT